MNDKEIISTLAVAVARLLNALGTDYAQLGEGGSFVQRDENGEININGQPVGEPDSGWNMAENLLDREGGEI